MDIAGFGEKTTGTVDERQTTYLKFTNSESGLKYRIDYKNKIEFFIKPGPFTGISIVDKHPLLDEHEHTNTILYIFGKSTEHKLVASQITEAIHKHYEGWRRIQNYCNQDYGFEKILDEGSGLLYDGPPSGAEVIKKILKEHDISPSTPWEGKNNGKKYKVLFLGSNYVVARNFEFVV